MNVATLFTIMCNTIHVSGKFTFKVASTLNALPMAFELVEKGILLTIMDEGRMRYVRKMVLNDFIKRDED